MNPRRFALAAALCGAAVLAGWAAAGLAGRGSAGMDKPSAPLEPRVAVSLAANAGPAPAPPADSEPAEARYIAGAAGLASLGSPGVVNAAAPLKPGGAAPVVARAEPAPAPHVDPEPAETGYAAPIDGVAVANAATDGAAATEPGPIPPPGTPPLQFAALSTPDPVEDGAREAGSSVHTVDECLGAEACIDQYLFSLYQRTPKVDSITVSEKIKVLVKKKGKMRTVTKTVTKLVDEDFAWKDPKAAQRAGMPLVDYVIGGMDPGFKLRLYHALRALDDAGLSPGITSAFRDDYRQSLASGLKAATDGSYHGGSRHGGYGHGLAADIVSVKGETRSQRWLSSEELWKWIDAHGTEFGIGRPYLDRDPPHVAPIDGKEYANHRGRTNKHLAGLATSRRHKLDKRSAPHANRASPGAARS